MSEDSYDQVPCSGSCARCKCALSTLSCESDSVWYCCGACAGSAQCSCGCRGELSADISEDVYIPGRRMYGSRHPDELKTDPDFRDKLRAFPFADRSRGR